MELKGTVILDKSSMDYLREEIREEVVADIEKNGSYGTEIERYLKDCSCNSYVALIKESIDKIIEKTDESQLTFDSDRKAYRRLLAIKSVLSL